MPAVQSLVPHLLGGVGDREGGTGTGTGARGEEYSQCIIRVGMNSVALCEGF